MKAEVTLAKRPRSGEGRGKLRYLDLSFDGWTDNGLTNGCPDNGRKPHGGYKGLRKHPMGIHSFSKGADYQQHLQQERQVLEQERLQSPTWALQVHQTPTHSGESPLLSGRLMSASKHETINGRPSPEKETPRTTRCATPNTKKKAASYYRPNSTHQYLTATELKDAADCEEVLRYGRPTRTTLLRARHRVSSASSSAYEARRQKEQRMMEVKKVTAFYSPEELAPVYSDAEQQSFYSFLLGARYNRAHCLDSRSLERHGVYMPRSNPLGCFVITDKTDLDLASAPADSPRSDVGQVPRPQTERQRRPTTAPSYGRKSSARAPRTPRTPRTPRQAWGDVTVSLHVTNGARQTVILSKDGPCKFETRLPVVHGTSLSKLQRKFKEVSAMEEASEALQPPPSPISARGQHSLPPSAYSLDPPLPIQPNNSPPLPPDPDPDLDPIHQVTEENKVTAQEHEEQEDDNATTEGKVEKEGEEEQPPIDAGEREEGGEEREKAGKEGGVQENLAAGEASPEVGETKGEEEEVRVVDGVEEERMSTEEKNVAEDDDETTPANDMTDDVTESKEEAESDRKNLNTPPDSPPDTSPDNNPATQEPGENDEGEKRNDEDEVKFFVTEQVDNDDKANDAETNLADEVMESVGDVPPSDSDPPENKPPADEDALSTTSSKKSHSKHVSFKIPPVEDTNFNPVVTSDNDENIDDNVEDEDHIAHGRAGNGVEVLDSDADDVGQGQSQEEQEPLRVIVTHIEKNLGAPAPKEAEEEVIAEDP